MAMALRGSVQDEALRPREQQLRQYTSSYSTASQTTSAPTRSTSRLSRQNTSVTNQRSKTGNKQPDIRAPARNMFGVILDKPKYRHYATIDSRLRSFKQWPNGTGQTPETLAEAGFAYTGTGDAVRCYYCAGGFNEWSEKHDPWKEHARHYSQCAHVRQCKGEEFIQMVNRENSDQSGVELDKTNGKALALLKDEYDNEVAIEAAIEFTDKERVERAVKYFRKTNRDKKFTATELLEVVDMMENTDVSEATGLDENTAISEATELDESTAISEITALDENTDDTEEVNVEQKQEEEEDASCRDELEKENLKLKEARMCKICLEAEACITTLPCGHMISCPQCIPALVKCAICREPIKGTVRAQMAS